MGTQVTYGPNLPEIASEFIEPYAQRFFMMQLESVNFGLITPQQARDYLTGVNYFISVFGGLHAKIATSNVYDKFSNMTDEQIKNIADKTFK